MRDEYYQQYPQRSENSGELSLGAGTERGCLFPSFRIGVVCGADIKLNPLDTLRSNVNQVPFRQHCCLSYRVLKAPAEPGWQYGQNQSHLNPGGKTVSFGVIVGMLLSLWETLFHHCVYHNTYIALFEPGHIQLMLHHDSSSISKITWPITLAALQELG